MKNKFILYFCNNYIFKNLYFKNLYLYYNFSLIYNLIFLKIFLSFFKGNKIYLINNFIINYKIIYLNWGRIKFKKIKFKNYY